MSKPPRGPKKPKPRKASGYEKTRLSTAELLKDQDKRTRCRLDRAGSRDLTVRQADFHLRQIESAHKRFLSAVATLARVRKLALPALQVNFGDNQVNVASHGG